MKAPTAIKGLNALAEAHHWNVTEENRGDAYVWSAERWIDGEYEVGFTVEYDLNEHTRRWRQTRIEGYVSQSPGDGDTYPLGSVPLRAVSHVSHWLTRPEAVAQQVWVKELKESNGS